MDQPKPHQPAGLAANPAEVAVAAGPWYEALAEAINLILLTPAEEEEAA